MDIQSLNAKIMNQMSTYMKQFDSRVQGAVSQANEKNGNALGADVSFSKPSELLSQLTQLQSTDPEKFENLMSDISDSLAAEAQEAGTDTREGRMLGELAGKFKDALETGDLSKLKPPQGPQPEGTDQGKISQFLQNASSGDKTSVLDLLTQLDVDSSSSTEGSSRLSSIRDLLTQAFQQMLESKSSD
jgi:hypothetical protein